MLQKLLAFTKKVADLPDRPSLNSAELKAQFDAAPEELRQSFNNLVDALNQSPTWTDATLENGFLNYGGSDFNAGFTLDNLGNVYLRGCLKAGTNGQNAFTLPAGMRPSKTRSFPLSCNITGAFASIYPNGNVIVSFPGGYSWLYLDAVMFRAEQ
jgi:hypothetical protein